MEITCENTGIAQSAILSEKVKGNALSTSEEEYVACLLGKMNLDRVNRTSAPVVMKKGTYVSYIKRLLDFIIALAAFIIVSPVNIVLAVCTYFDVGSPIIFKQTRIGKNGKPFEIIKFRNMTNETDKDGKLLPASERVTKFGKFLRKYSLDELMNFWSVIKGDMSLIGPRPLPLFFNERYSERHKMRNVVRPGLECPRVLKNSEISKYHAQFENDIWYVENMGFLTDCYLVLQLVKMVFNVKYRSMGASSGSYFVGYDENGYATSMLKIRKTHPEYLEAFNKIQEKEQRKEDDAGEDAVAEGVGSLGRGEKHVVAV